MARPAAAARSVRPGRDDALVFIARLACPDAACAAEVTAEGRTIAELEALVCECGCALEIVAWPDWIDEPGRVVALPAERRRLRPAA
jgi:hypothetical protein